MRLVVFGLAVSSSWGNGHATLRRGLARARLDRLFLEPARRRPHARFVLAGSMYAADFPWGENVFHVRHLAPAEHPAFDCSSPLTIDVTRAPMAAMGFCPSGRLFEAAACGTPVLSDRWDGLDGFFEPGREILGVGAAGGDAVQEGA